MTRLTIRLTAAVAGLAACGVIVTGCSAGQIAQTANQQSAVNGTSANLQNIALRNVHLQAVQTSDFLQPGTAVQLMFVAANDSIDVGDKLVGITSDIGPVALAGDAAIPAASALVVGSPDGQSEVIPMGSATPATAEVTLDKPITNGLTYDFTFQFEKAGNVTVAVPISAGEQPRRG